MREIDVLAVQSVFADQDGKSRPLGRLRLYCVDDSDVRVVPSLPVFLAFQNLRHADCFAAIGSEPLLSVGSCLWCN